MIPAKETETVNDCSRRGARAFASLVVCSMIAGLLLASAPAVAQDKPIEIGVLALGPRKLPIWQCGSGAPQLAAAQPHHETMPVYVKGLLDELEKLKYVEDRPGNAGKPGRHFVMDLRMGTPQELKSAARDFARKRVDFIVAIATTATRIAQEETKDNPIPILFPGISDPIGDGFVQSLARPGGVITGVSHQLVQGSGKRVELFKEMLPGLKRMVTLRRPGYGPAEKSMPQIHAVAGRLRSRSGLDRLYWEVGATGKGQARSPTIEILRTAHDQQHGPDRDQLAQGVPTFGLQVSRLIGLSAPGPSATRPAAGLPATSTRSARARSQAIAGRATDPTS
jgi:hypothetical protein